MRTVTLKRLAKALSLSVLIAGGGCQTGAGADPAVVGKPLAGTGAAEVTVVGRPKAGDADEFERVTTYDAAPVRTKPTGQFEHVDYSHLTGLVVWLAPTEKMATIAPPAAVTIRASADREAKDILPVSVGQEVVIENTSGRGAGFYSVSEGNEFQFESLPAGSSTRVTIKTEGLIEIWSDPAKPPVAMLYAAPTPWVSAAHSGRKVRFEGVPPGQYRATGWHARLPVSTCAVDVTAGASATAVVTAGVSALDSETK